MRLQKDLHGDVQWGRSHSSLALPARRAFTLVELLVVILIVAVLVSLIGAAVARALGKGKEARNRDEIAQLSLSLENFKSKFGFYPPSTIRLCEHYNFYFQSPATQLVDEDSVQALTRMFPQMMKKWSATPTPAFPYQAGPSAPGIDWDGDGMIRQGGAILTGEQCLVFFLGGIGQAPTPTQPATVLGFSTNPIDPAATTLDRIGPYYEFQGTRLVGTSLFGYRDSYGSQPYLYFSSGKSPNNYGRYSPVGAIITDCSSRSPVNGNPVQPYYEGVLATGVKKYHNPNTFQIISAGADGLFGPGGINPWTPKTAGAFYPDGNPGKDDQANFYGSLLGTGD